MKNYKEVLLGLALSLALYLFLAFKEASLLPDNVLIFNVVTALYFIAGGIYLVYWIFGWEIGGLIGSSLGWAGFLANIYGFLIRWLQTHQTGYGYVPLSNLYESLVFFALCIAGFYLFWELRLKRKIFGSIIFILNALILAFATLKADSNIKPLIPALKSNWLIAHVITCFLGYGAFAVAFGVAIFYLLSHYEGIKHYLPDRATLESFIYRSMLFGFFWLSLGIITGAIWADQAWGNYWSWDPKETWSFITWLIYGGGIHARIIRGWTGKKIAWLNIIGFISVLFTYFGVNFLLSGLHSYGGLN